MFGRAAPLNRALSRVAAKHRYTQPLKGGNRGPSYAIAPRRCPSGHALGRMRPPSRITMANRLTFSRRGTLAAGLGAIAACLGHHRTAHATGPSVPARQQAELFAKAAKYDRRMGTRIVDGALRIVVAHKRSSAESEEVALLFARRLGEIGKIGDAALGIESVTVAGASDLVTRLRVGDVAAAYLSPGLRSQIGALADDLRGVSVLTVAASPEYVAEGLVLGFDLVDARPRLLVNLERARAQGVDFHSSFLKLSQIVT
jgi:hypothetical protein